MFLSFFTRDAYSFLRVLALCLLMGTSCLASDGEEVFRFNDAMQDAGKGNDVHSFCKQVNNDYHVYDQLNSWEDLEHKMSGLKRMVFGEQEVDINDFSVKFKLFQVCLEWIARAEKMLAQKKDNSTSLSFLLSKEIKLSSYGLLARIFEDMWEDLTRLEEEYNTSFPYDTFFSDFALVYPSFLCLSWTIVCSGVISLGEEGVGQFFRQALLRRNFLMLERLIESGFDPNSIFFDFSRSEETSIFMYTLNQYIYLLFYPHFDAKNVDKNSYAKIIECLAESVNVNLVVSESGLAALGLVACEHSNFINKYQQDLETLVGHEMCKQEQDFIDLLRFLLAKGACCDMTFTYRKLCKVSNKAHGQAVTKLKEFSTTPYYLLNENIDSRTEKFKEASRLEQPEACLVESKKLLTMYTSLKNQLDICHGLIYTNDMEKVMFKAIEKSELVQKHSDWHKDLTKNVVSYLWFMPGCFLVPHKLFRS